MKISCDLSATVAMSAAISGLIPDGNGLLLRNILVRRFGFRTEFPGATEQCLRKFLCLSTGLFMSATMKRRPMHAGQERNCRAKRNGIEPRTRPATAGNGRTLGARKHRPQVMAI